VTDSQATNNRQLLGIAIAAGLGVALVLVMLYVTLSAGGSDSDANGPTTTTTLPLSAITTPPGVKVPPGDYTAVCAALADQGGKFDGVPTQAQLLAFFRSMDFAPLIAVAPPDLVPSLETMRDQREAVFEAIGKNPDLRTVNADSLPDGFTAALTTVSTAMLQKCN